MVKYCLQCHKIIKPYNKFCDKSCAAKYNNRGKRRHGKAPGKCLNCGKRLLESKRKYCSHKCDQECRYKEYIQRWLSNQENGIIGIDEVSRHIHRWLREKHNNKCQKCQWDKKHPITNKVPLHINHIDGNWQNNRPENLELLCPNCHALTPNYGSLNTGKGRRTYRKNMEA